MLVLLLRWFLIIDLKMEKEKDDLMDRVLNGEPFTTWDDYNRKYNKYMAENNQIEERQYREKTCLHPDGCITRLPDGRMKCTYCGRTQY